ncbi:hypothetical protein V8C86DRAFT_3137908 [Haematococcus lacustris]
MANKSVILAAVHDLEHVGLTNDFLNNSDHDLVAFYDFVGTPMSQNFTHVFPSMQPMMDQLHTNYRYWKAKFPPPP